MGTLDKQPPDVIHLPPMNQELQHYIAFELGPWIVLASWVPLFVAAFEYPRWASRVLDRFLGL